MMEVLSHLQAGKLMEKVVIFILLLRHPKRVNLKETNLKKMKLKILEMKNYVL